MSAYGVTTDSRSGTNTKSRSFVSSICRPIIDFRSNLSTVLSQTTTSLSHTGRRLWSVAPTTVQLWETWGTVTAWCSRYRDWGDRMGMGELTTAANEAAKTWLKDQDIE